MGLVKATVIVTVSPEVREPNPKAGRVPSPLESCSRGSPKMLPVAAGMVKGSAGVAAVQDLKSPLGSE